MLDIKYTVTAIYGKFIDYIFAHFYYCITYVLTILSVALLDALMCY